MARSISVFLLGNSESLERAFKRSSRSAQKFSKDMSQVGRGAAAGSGLFSGLGRQIAFASSGFIGAAGFVAATKASVNAASDLNEQMSKSNVVFGKSAQAVQDWADTTTEAFGLSERQALATASSFGALFQPLGLTGPLAAEQSRKLTQLGADLASFYNTDVQSALDAIRSGIVGESEPLRQYGVLLSETRVQQEALTETGKKSVTQLTAQEKALARITLIFLDSAQAQGDFARTSTGFANQTRILRANIDDLAVSFGQHLVPKLTLATTGLNNFITDLTDPDASVGKTAQEIRALGEAFGFVADKINVATGKAGGWAKVLPFLIPPLGLGKLLVDQFGMGKGDQGARAVKDVFNKTAKGPDAFGAAIQAVVADQATKKAAAAAAATQRKATSDAAAAAAAIAKAKHDQIAAEVSAAADAARQEAIAWADFAIEKAGATKTLKDDLRAAEGKLRLLEQQAGTAKKTADQARQIWEAQQEVTRLTKLIAGESKTQSQFHRRSASSIAASIPGLTAPQRVALSQQLAGLGSGLTTHTRSQQFAAAGARGGVVVTGDLHLHGVQDPKQLADALAKHARARPPVRRGSR